jgi:hypothetical protein
LYPFSRTSTILPFILSLGVEFDPSAKSASNASPFTSTTSKPLATKVF